MTGNPDRRFRVDRLQDGVITHAKPRRPLRHAIRNYWPQALAFVVFLVVWFLFWAVNVPGV